MKRTLILVIAAGTGAAQAGVVYTNTDTGPLGFYGNLDANALMLDEVLIPLNRLNGMTRLSVKKIEVQVFAPVAGAYEFDAFYTTSSVLNNQLRANFPPVHFAEAGVHMSANASQTVEFGDGSSELFQVDLLRPGNAQFRTFFFGLKFKNSHQNIGWWCADGPDVNLDGFIGYYGANDPRNGLKTWSGGARGSFWMRISADPVPEPSTAVVLGVSFTLAAIRKRRRSAK